jgi:hypothetical protein
MHATSVNANFKKSRCTVQTGFQTPTLNNATARAKTRAKCAREGEEEGNKYYSRPDMMLFVISWEL